METINTNRLILRQIQESDKELLFPLLTDNLVQEFIPYIYCENTSDIDEFIFLEQPSDFENDFCFILESKETKEIIGLIKAYVTLDKILCVSYAIKESARGNGFICEALKAFIMYIFLKELNILYVEFSIRKDNQPSVTIMKKLNVPLYLKKANYNNYRLSMQEKPSW